MRRIASRINSSSSALYALYTCESSAVSWSKIRPSCLRLTLGSMDTNTRRLSDGSLVRSIQRLRSNSFRIPLIVAGANAERSAISPAVKAPPCWRKPSTFHSDAVRPSDSATAVWNATAESLSERPASRRSARIAVRRRRAARELFFLVGIDRAQSNCNDSVVDALVRLPVTGLPHRDTHRTSLYRIRPERQCVTGRLSCCHRRVTIIFRYSEIK